MFSFFWIVLVVTEFPKKGSFEMDKCNSTAKLEGCYWSHATNYSKLNTINLVLNYWQDDESCIFDKSYFQWLVKNSKDEEISNEMMESNGNVLVMKPYALKTDTYTVDCFVWFVTKEKEIINNLESCLIQILPEAPIAVIEGGSERTVLARTSILIDGSKSIDMDVKPGEPQHLSYNWQCTVQPLNDFCQSPLGEESLVRVPEKFAQKGLKYVFTMRVRTTDTEWQTAKQTIVVENDVVEIEIVCEKNCPPAAPFVNPKQITFLKAVCVRNCEKLKENFYDWTIDDQNFDYDRDTQFGGHVDKFIINADVLKTKTTYTIRVTLTGGLVGGSAKLVEVPTSLSIDSCEIAPRSGTAIIDTFEVRNCNSNANVIKFEVFVKKDALELLVVGGPSLQDLKFTLPTNVEVFIKAIDSSGKEAISQLQVSISPAVQDENDSAIKKITADIQNLVKEMKYKKGLQVIGGLIEETVHMKKGKVRDEIGETILRNLNKIPVNTLQDALQLTILVGKIVQNNPENSNPFTGSIATDICRNAAKKMLEGMESERFPKSSSRNVQQASKALLTCYEVDSQPNFDSLKSGNETETTPFPLLPAQVIAENYPDYEDNFVVEKRSKFEQISKNSIEICRANTGSMVLTMAAGEKPMVTLTRFCKAFVAKLAGNLTSIHFEGLTIAPPEDFKPKIVDILGCSWVRNPFWWHGNQKEPNTQVVFLEFRDSKSGRKMEEFSEPLEVEFYLDLHKQHAKIHEFQFPSLKVDREDHMAVLRVDVKRKESLVIEFLHLSEIDHFDVVVTDFVRPQPSDLDDTHVVTKDQHILMITNDHDYDGWRYIGILPNDKMAGNTTYIPTFWISVYSLACYSWNVFQSQWEFACQAIPEFDKNLLRCKCYHLSVLAGMIFNAEVRIDNVGQEPNFLMVLLKSPTIFICTSTVFALYCIVLIFATITKKPTVANIYFLGDVTFLARYLYLVVVKTQTKKSSGTSSNICIKIYGDKAKTKAHLLNYPDPQLRMLQRGDEDWFFLANETYLGKLQEIALWSDSSGRNPVWWCKEITIYDVQTEESWRFLVNHRFHLLFEPIYVKVPVGGSEKSLGRIAKIFDNCTNPKKVDRLSCFEKLTVFLSIALTTYGISLMLYGLPELRLRDGFAPINHFGLHGQVFWITFVSSILTITIHAPLVFFLEKNNEIATKCCWCFLVFNLVITMSICIIFGFWLPLVTSWLWLTSTVGALLVYGLVFQNFYVCYRNFRSTTEERGALVLAKLKRVLWIVEEQRKYLFKIFGPALLRPYFSHLYQPPDEEEIEEKKKRLEEKLLIIELLEDLFMFLLYLSLLYLVILANKDKFTIDSFNEMSAMVSGKQTRSVAFSETSSSNSFDQYLEATLVPAMQDPQWYWKFMVRNPGLMKDFQNKYLGVARLRQHRVPNSSCKVPELSLSFSNTTQCRFKFSSGGYFGSFGEEISSHRLKTSWKYTKFAGTTPYAGKLAVYPGGGYVAFLGRTKHNSLVNLKYLRKKKWVDCATRVVFIEFLAYNTNCNLFNAVRLVVEKSATGYVRVKVEIETARLLLVKEETELVSSAIFVAFFTVLAIFTMKLAARIWKKRKSFVRDRWNLVDGFIIAMSFACFVLFVYRSRSIGKFLESLEKSKHNEFIQYFHLFYLESVLVAFSAILVCVSTIRLWKLLRFGTVFKIMETTLLLSAPPLLALLLCQIFVVLGFGLCGYVMFGNFSHDFQDLPNTLITLLLLSLNLYEAFDFKTLTYDHKHLGYFYYATFMVATLLIYTIYVAIIMLYYSEAQLIYSNEEPAMALRKYLANELYYFTTVVKVGTARLKGGKSLQRQYVTSKAEEHRYANCMCLASNKMKVMNTVALWQVKRRRLSSSQRGSLMARAAYFSLQTDDSEKEIFFKSRMGENHRIMLIHDIKMTEIERIVQVILSQKNRKKMKKKKIVDYKKSVDRQLKKLKLVNSLLNTILHILSNIEFN